MATFVTSALIDAIAQSVDVKLSTEAARALAPDVEYKLRELIQVRGSARLVPGGLTARSSRVAQEVCCALLRRRTPRSLQGTRTA